MINVETPEYEDYIFLLKRRIEKDTNAGALTEQTLREIINENPIVKANLDDKECEAIARYFEQRFQTVQNSDTAQIQAKDYKPWLLARKKTIDPFYWGRFEKYCEEDENLPIGVVKSLDETSDQILDYVGDPEVTENFQRRGMVIGHVQSGKTLSYSAVICKAADAGYKVIIVLSGMTNSLRRQTQDRLDHAFIGKKATFGQRGIPLKNIGVGKYLVAVNQKQRFPSWGTTAEGDFSQSVARNFGVAIQNLREPIIFITKKNTSTLKNLNQWLQQFYPTGSIPHPLLLIDDEADNASINTKSAKGEITAINEGIRDILKQFEKASYLAYTATPFANIFISPETNDEMVGEDLFPKDYIKLLDPPSNYVGPDKVFGEGSELEKIMVRNPTDYEDILPVKHKNHADIEILPPSLHEAVLLFVLVRAIRITQGRGHLHCSMMVNVSRFNSVQESVMEKIWAYKGEVENEIRLKYKDPNGASRSKILSKLQELYQSEYKSPRGDNADVSGGELPEWNVIKDNLHEAIASIVIRIVNMKAKDRLDYDDERHKSTGLHVIAVGGLALSRGLTLEGLCISYVLRNPSAYDTLMQMGRWFGYRPHYENLCRLYIPDFAHDYYQYVTEAIEELRSEIYLMEERNQTPNEFGLKVREHDLAINITAKNKMGGAQAQTLAVGFERKHEEGHTVYIDPGVNDHHKRLLTELFDKLPDPVCPEDINTTRLFWSDVSKGLISSFLAKIKLPRKSSNLHVNSNGNSLVLDYIADRPNELEKWDIAIVENNRGETVEDSWVPGKKIQRRNRKVAVHKIDGTATFYGSRQRVGDKKDPSWGISKEKLKLFRGTNANTFNDKRDKPLLLIHDLAITEQDSTQELPIENVITFSVCFPRTSVASRERKYQVNEVYRQMNMFDDVDEQDLDEDMEYLDE